MQIFGITAEYNPFHNGHFHLIQEAKKQGATHIVAVMSGNFVQRGECAMLSKFDRTRQALSCGIDLVIELPVAWSLSSAETFASGAVSLFTALGCIDALAFGSECASLSALKRCAHAVCDQTVLKKTKASMRQGFSFPVARQYAVSSLYGEQTANLLSSPNDILNVEYLKALHIQKSKITPVPIPRKGVAHDSLSPAAKMMSASQIRNLVQSGNCFTIENYLPEASFSILMDTLQSRHAPADIRYLERAILAELRQATPEQLALIPDVTEGLENRMIGAAQTAENYVHLLEAMKTKRYPLSRLKRILLWAFLGLSMPTAMPPYLRVLGMNTRGEEILKEAKPNASLPIFSNYKQTASFPDIANTVYSMECRATDLYNLALPVPLPAGLDKTYGIITV